MNRSGAELRRHGLTLFNEQFPIGNGQPMFPFTLRALLLIKVFRCVAVRRVLAVYYEKVGGNIQFQEALSIGNAPVTARALQSWRNAAPNGLPPIPAIGPAIATPLAQPPTGAQVAAIAAIPAPFVVHHFNDPAPVSLTIPAGCIWFQIPNPNQPPGALLPLLFPQPAGIADCTIDLRAVMNELAFISFLPHVFLPYVFMSAFCVYFILLLLCFYCLLS
jgi:hypothetical protein